jgi:lipopolysaccharide transport system ATP-binding protein
MSDAIAIRTEGLGKRYTIGGQSYRDPSLRDALSRPFRRLAGGGGAKGAAPRAAAGDGVFWALRDANLQIRHGENVGIIGLNGAGKSTLLKILSRITEPTEGQAVIDGRVGALLEVGTGFALALSGRDNVFLYGSILGMRREEVARKFDAIVEFSGVGKLIDLPVKRYSSGMYVRLAFAVAAHLEPEILFLDEVLAVGDLSFQRKCFEFARELQRRDATILFVSHNMFSIKTMCDRVIYLSKGRIEYDGPVDAGIELYERDCRLTVLSWEGAGKPEEWPVYIDRCELSGADGRVKTVFDFGEKMRIKLDYLIRGPMPSPNFMVAFVRSDGVTCCTYSTEHDGLDLGTLTADGVLELDVPPLKLVAEMYTVQVTVRRKGFQDIVCAQVGTTFHVRDELLSMHFGVFHEPATWRHPPGRLTEADAGGRSQLTAIQG